MHKPDRIGVLVLAILVFSMYIDLANVLTSMALVSLPLGTVGSSWMGSTTIVILATINTAILYLYLNRQGKRVQQSPIVQK